MCRAASKTGKENNICVYCGSTNHTSGRCTNRPNNHREESRSTPRELQDNRTNNAGKNCILFQNRDPSHQARFDERYNRQYSPINNGYQPSPVISVPGLDLSATLVELANIQSRSLEMMATSQRNQQEAFHELTRVRRDKAHNAMFTTIKTYNGENRQAFEDWTNEINQACQVSGHDFRTEIIKKSTGVVHQVVMACDSLSDNDLLTKLRISFSDTPTMNQAWEDLRNLRQGENDSVTVYIYKWGCTFVRSSGISVQNENHPHIIKDFISSLKRSIRNKIANTWVEMRRKPHTVQDAFSLAANIETQIQVADSFKLNPMNDLPPVEVNEISTGETSGEEYEVNGVYKGKKWSNNQYRKSSYSNNHNSNNRYQKTKTTG